MDKPAQTPEQQQFLKERMTSIGASEAAAVLGLHPWLSPIQVWVSKVHPELVEPRDNFLLKLGTRLEPVIAACYEDETGRKLVQGNKVTHPDYPEISASPDRITWDVVPGRLVELKSCNEFVKDEFGDFGTQDVPQAYLIQAWVQIEVTKVPDCDIAALLGGAKFGIYPIPEDREVQQSIVEQLREWWDHYVVAKKEPPIDASQGWVDYILRRYPAHGGGMVKVNPTEHAELVEDILGYASARGNEEGAKANKELYANRIKAFIQDHDGLLLPGGGNITWKKSKDSTEDQVYWEGIAGHLVSSGKLTEVEMSKLIADYTKKGVITKAGSRRFIYSEGGK